MFSENQLLALCQERGLPQIFQSREESMYLIRLSQCKTKWSFQVVYSWDNLYKIKCPHPPCHFHLKVSKSKTGEHLSSGVWWQTCSINDHVISKYKSPALDCNFLARYLLQHIKNGVASWIKLRKILITELGCNVKDSTIGWAFAVATSKLLFNEDKGYNLMQSYCDHRNMNGVYAHLDTVEEKQNEVAVSYEDFPYKRFIRMLQAQKQVTPYAKFAGLDACNLTVKFKEMLICATNQDSNGTIFILAHGLVPREDEEIGYTSSDTLKMLD